MRKVFVLALHLVFTGSLLYGAPAPEPSKLPPQRLAEYFNMRRNLDRWLQQGQFGPAISTGKQILKEYVSQDAYASYCLAAAYCSLEYDEDEENWEEGLKHLEEAIDWGFLNTDILKTSMMFEKVRKDEKFATQFDKLIEYVEKQRSQDAERVRREFPSTVKKLIEEAKPRAFALDSTGPDGTPVKAEQFAGKPLVVVVLRPRHDGVASALPEYKKLNAKAAERGIAVLGAIYNYSFTDRLKKEAARFVAGAELGVPVALVERPWVKEYGILNLPSHLLVGANGKVLCHIDGVLQDWQLEAILDVVKESGA